MKPHDEQSRPPPGEEEPPPGVTLREHAYDGIREYDQRLPRWWLLTLHGAIAFSIVYWVVRDQDAYQGGEHPGMEKELAALEERRAMNSIDVDDDERFLEMSGNPEIVEAGRSIYEQNCAACHGENLEGGIGFNLVDDEWVHGSRPSEIYESVAGGFPDKGMIPWEDRIGQKRVARVVAYILDQNNR